MVFYAVQVTAPQLWESRHRPEHLVVAARVRDLRDTQGLTFAEIASVLNREGVPSPRGKRFYAALAYSIYRKWRRRAERAEKAKVLSLQGVLVSDA